VEFDFGSLSFPGKSALEIEPRALLRSLPVREGAINDLWDGQAQALSAWHQRRSENDNLVLLNTGAGKTIVGLLIAESLRRETRGNVVYLCPTNDLINQVSKEASKLGLQYTIRSSSEWSNDLYDRGQAVCITNYQALLNSRTLFRNDRGPNAVVLDDAHVAEGVIRDQFTLRVTAGDHGQLFQSLKATILAHEQDASYRAKIEQTFSGTGVYSTILISPAFGRERHAEITELFRTLVDKDDASLTFPLGHLYGKWALCAFTISRNSIEVSPPVLPTLALRVFQDPAVRRVYLSATLGQAVDFAKAFGKEIDAPIRPDVDAGNGERLILFSSRLGGEKAEAQLVDQAASIDKILIAVPNNQGAERWKGFGSPPRSDRFSTELDAFRNHKGRGAFILVGRYDGIDLPQETCRLMALDGVPRGTSLLERYCWEYLDLKADLRSRIATRITQLFGRIIRGRVDNGCFLILSRDLNVWLSDDRNLALLPDLLSAQILLGLYVHEKLGVDNPEKAKALIAQVLGRDDGWVNSYRQWVNSQAVDARIREKATDQQLTIKDAALRWVQYWSALWAGDDPGKIGRLRDAIEGLLARLAAADSRGAGWLNIWLGSQYLAGGEDSLALDHFARARSRLLTELPLPYPVIDKGGLSEDKISPMGKVMLELFRGGVVDINNRIQRDDRALAPLTGEPCSTNEYEEALKHLGERLGFLSSRPDNEQGTGPDVLWRCAETKKAIAFEAKTEKTTDIYTKADIGQAHQHIQWLEDNEKGFKSLGVVLIGPATRVTDQASPSPSMFRVGTDAISRLTAAYKDLRTSVRKEIGSSRIAGIAPLGRDDEWEIEHIFRGIGASNF
jgi:hypothetical protein